MGLPLSAVYPSAGAASLVLLRGASSRATWGIREASCTTSNAEQRRYQGGVKYKGKSSKSKTTPAPTPTPKIKIGARKSIILPYKPKVASVQELEPLPPTQEQQQELQQAEAHSTWAGVRTPMVNTLTAANKAMEPQTSWKSVFSSFVKSMGFTINLGDKDGDKISMFKTISGRVMKYSLSELKWALSDQEKQEIHDERLKNYKVALLDEGNKRTIQVRRAWSKIVDQLGLTAAGYNLYIYHPARLPNRSHSSAFASGGLDIYVSTYLFDGAITEDICAFVLLHELAHNKCHHTAERRLRCLAGEDFYQVRREHEYEADKVALFLLALTQFDLRAGITHFKIASKKDRYGSPPGDAAQEHPSDGDRIKKLEDLLPKARNIRTNPAKNKGLRAHINSWS